MSAPSAVDAETIATRPTTSITPISLIQLASPWCVIALCLFGYLLTRIRIRWYPLAPSGSVPTSSRVWRVPVPSWARTRSVYSPGVVGFQTAAHNTHVYLPSGSLETHRAGGVHAAGARP